MNFKQLIQNISDTHDIFQIRAFQSVNVNLTLRNWFFVMYIVEYEQNGKDRANYGDAVIREIAKQLKNSTIKGLSFTNLNIFRQFYLLYPQIIHTASEQFDFQQLKQALPVKQNTINQMETLLAEVKSKKIQTLFEQLIPTDTLISRLSFSHFVELIKCDDNLQRTFYELESIKGTWAVRELKRQMNSLLFERTDKQMFISKYKVALPSKEELKQLLQKELKYIDKVSSKK